MSIKVGVVGAGAFSSNFIPLFKAHPLVSEVILCDIDSKKLKEKQEMFNIDEGVNSLEELCKTDVDSVAIFTQNWLHGPQALKALKAGKHVYSAVPMGITVEEIADIVEAVETTGNIYMMGETSYYYPEAIYCREKAERGEFGHIVYGEAEYLHDWDHNLYDVMKRRGGRNWRKYAGNPPMKYSTHSVSMIVSVTGAHMTHVSCQGFADHESDGIYKKDANIWGNTFSNQSALFKMSDGSMGRINEFRRIGTPGSVTMSLYGTNASFQKNGAGAVWTTKNREETMNIDELLTCRDIDYKNVSKLHSVKRLPQEYKGLSNGHCGSHQFLIDDFVKACVEGAMPPNNAWEAARYTLPGIIANESSQKGGVLLEIPDFGDPRNE